MSERVWAKFRAVEEPTIEAQIDEALALVDAGPLGRPLTSDDLTHIAAVCGHARLCELPADHDGQHQIGPLRWGEA
ncbi:MAG TPA: hypothetical protein VNS09_02170 [Solirubrobacter sp.]|nr:hypothetical protein [Solirubrobacter sp.]